MGFVDASRTGGILILTHRRNLVDQFHGELKQRGYAKRITPALLQGKDNANGPVTVETYQWFVRNAGKISEAYSIVICDEAHTALGEKTSAAIRRWTGPIFIGMTATGALIARHVTDLFPTQTSRFDLAQAARRGVISPLRCVRIPPGQGVNTIAKVPLRRGEVDTEFDQEMLAELLDQGPFNFAAADLYKTRFNGVPGVVYAAGVKHAYNLAEAFRAQGVKAMAVSGETRKRELAEILARYERGDIDVLVNAQLLAEGWNSPRATVCMHLAPTASKRIYQQRVGRVTRRNPGKESGIVVDFVAPGTKNDDPVVTLHSLLDRDVYRGGAIVVGPVRRGRGRRLRVERRVLPVTSDEDRRIEVFERELWRIAVEHLIYGEQIQWAALAGARVAPSGWRRARAMLHFDREGAIKRAFLEQAVQRNKNPQLRVRALQEIAASRDGEAFDTAIDVIGTWTREERREGTKVMLLALAEKRIGRRDQANAWIWRLASYTRDVHEEYAVQRWPETKRLLGLLVNSSGAAHARNARRLVHAARKQDRRLSAALLAAAIAHTPEGEEILRGARTRLARKPSALSRELLRNFPKSRGRRGSRRRRKKGAGELGEGTPLVAQVSGEASTFEGTIGEADNTPPSRSGSRRSRSRNGRAARQAAAAGRGRAAPRPSRRRRMRRRRRRRSRSRAVAVAALAVTQRPGAGDACRRATARTAAGAGETSATTRRARSRRSPARPPRWPPRGARRATRGKPARARASAARRPRRTIAATPRPPRPPSGRRARSRGRPRGGKPSARRPRDGRASAAAEPREPPAQPRAGASRSPTAPSRRRQARRAAPRPRPATHAAASRARTQPRRAPRPASRATPRHAAKPRTQPRQGRAAGRRHRRTRQARRSRAKAADRRRRPPPPPSPTRSPRQGRAAADDTAAPAKPTRSRAKATAAADDDPPHPQAHTQPRQGRPTPPTTPPPPPSPHAAARRPGAADGARRPRQADAQPREGRAAPARRTPAPAAPARSRRKGRDRAGRARATCQAGRAARPRADAARRARPRPRRGRRREARSAARPRRRARRQAPPTTATRPQSPPAPGGATSSRPPDAIAARQTRSARASPVVSARPSAAMPQCRPARPRGAASTLERHAGSRATSAATAPGRRPPPPTPARTGADSGRGRPRSRATAAGRRDSSPARAAAPSSVKVAATR